MVRGGLDVVVLGDPSARERVESAGARFLDMFEGRPLAPIDRTSFPNPVRWVTYTARYADELIEQLRSLDAQVVALDGHAMMGRLAAQALGLPHVIVCAGHNIHPDDVVPMLAAEPRVRASDECWQAAERLREEYGLADASPFCWVPPPSPYLNIVSEPRQFFSAAERERFEPVSFFGSLSEEDIAPPATQSGEATYFPPDARLRVYVSLGMSGWNAARALMGEGPIRALHAIAEGIAALPGAHGLLALGGGTIDDELRRELEGPRFRVETRVEQLQVLAETDAFVTHHGIHSTHEAVARRVPMLSYPLWWDQPGLAQRCQELGLALPLVEEPLGLVDPDRVQQALLQVEAERERLAGGLSVAREWEERVIAERPQTVELIAELAGVESAR